MKFNETQICMKDTDETLVPHGNHFAQLEQIIKVDAKYIVGTLS